MLARTRSWLRSLFRRSRLDAEFDAEVRDHLERRTRDLVAAGFSYPEATRRARAEFGAVDAMKEGCRESRGLWLADEVIRNLRYGLRMLARSPIFTLTAVLTLGLCIGANTAIFSVIDAVLLRPLPYPEPDRLALVVLEFEYDGRQRAPRVSQTGHVWELLRDHASSFDAAVFKPNSRGVSLVADGAVEHVREQRVAAAYFRLLGVAPRMGREFTAAEDTPGGAAVAVVSHALWRNTMMGDADAVGKSILLRGEPYEVVGVMPEEFANSHSADVWTPIRASRHGEGEGQNFQILARLRPGVSWAEARTQAALVAGPALEGRSFPPGVDAKIGLTALQDGMTQSMRTPLLILQGAVGLVLFIGCVNVAGLLLARASRRKREIATRMTLGGGQPAILRQLLTESALLALLGGAAGIVLGYGGVRLIGDYVKGAFGIDQPIVLDGRVLLFTIAISLLTSLVFGLFPALRTSRVEIRPSLAEGGRGMTIGGGRWSRRALVVVEVALCFVLLASAGLLLRTIRQVYSLEPGFDGTHVLTAGTSLRDARYETTASVVELFGRTLERLRALPGVEHAAVGLSLPFQRALNTGFRRADGEVVLEKAEITNLIYVTTDYFAALRIPLLQGRGFHDADGEDAKKVAVVNRELVRLYFPGEDVIGRHIHIENSPREIIGIVGDVQQQPGFGRYGPLGRLPAVYMPASQVGDGFMRLVHTWFSPRWIVRSAGPQTGLAAAMQRELRGADVQLPFTGVSGIEQFRRDAVRMHRLQAALLATFAGIALLLAAIGIYGLISSTVSARGKELGLRMALGANAADAMRTVSLPGLALTIAGLAAGALLSLAAAPVTSRLIWGVEPNDPLTLASVALLLTLVGAAATLLPTLRILRLNPADSLRAE